MNSSKQDSVKCQLCEKDFSSKSEVVELDSIVKSVKITFSIQSSLKSHILSIHERIKFNCEKCEKSFADKKYLAIHEEAHQLKENGLVLQCNECKSKFDLTKSFRSHVNRNHKGKRIEPVMVLKEPDEGKEIEVEIYDQVLEKSLLSKTACQKTKRIRKGKWIVKLKRIAIS